MFYYGTFQTHENKEKSIITHHISIIQLQQLLTHGQSYFIYPTYSALPPMYTLDYEGCNLHTSIISSVNTSYAFLTDKNFFKKNTYFVLFF